MRLILIEIFHCILFDVYWLCVCVYIYTNYLDLYIYILYIYTLSIYLYIYIYIYIHMCMCVCVCICFNTFIHIIYVFVGWLTISSADQDLLIECDQMRFLFQYSLPWCSHTSCTSVAVLRSQGSKKSLTEDMMSTYELFCLTSNDECA